jgi:hypothetical protein
MGLTLALAPISFGCVGKMSLRAAGTDAPDAGSESSRLFSAAMAIVQAKCVSCHQSGGAGVDFTPYLTDEAGWVRSNLVVPQHPEQSLFYQYLQGSGFSPPPLGTMPMGRALLPEELMTFHDWIAQFSPDVTSNPTATAAGPSQSSVRLGERSYVKSVLDDVFGGPRVSSSAASCPSSAARAIQCASRRRAVRPSVPRVRASMR